jgi:hypothetical protein
VTVDGTAGSGPSTGLGLHTDNVTVTRSRIANVTQGAEFNGYTGRTLTISNTSIVNTSTPIVNKVDQNVDADQNYLGPGCPIGNVTGNVTVDPFYTAPVGEVNTEQTQRFGQCLTFEAGKAYSFGTPGPMEDSLDEMFADFQGAIYTYNASARAWEQADGTERLDALEAVVVVPTTNTTAFVDYQDASPSIPGDRALDAGWQFVAPRSYNTPDRAFQSDLVGYADLLGLHPGPGNQPASGDGVTRHGFESAGGPTVSPYRGYFVYVTDPGTIPAVVPAGPTIQQIAALLRS